MKNTSLKPRACDRNSQDAESIGGSQVYNNLYYVNHV
jgi:hypothetical protein